MENQRQSRKLTTTLFGKICQNYNKLNRLLSLGFDSKCRNRVVSYVPPGDNLVVVDVATGACNQIVAMKKCTRIKRFIGIDMSEEMLLIGQANVDKMSNVELRLGNAKKLPLNDDTADCVTLSFAIKYIDDAKDILTEAFRILKPGGKLIVLEQSFPKLKPIKWLYEIYLRSIFPRLVKNIGSSQTSTEKLVTSVYRHDSVDLFSLMNMCNFINVDEVNMFIGICKLTTGKKPILQYEGFIPRAH